MPLPAPHLNRRLHAWVLPASAVLAASILVLPYGLAWARGAKRGTFYVPSRQEALAGAQDFVAKQASVVVQAGDTLWDLCHRYTGKPEIWPQIWAMNPQLTNPHWLPPGSVIYFVAAAKNAVGASEVAVAHAMDVAAADAPLGAGRGAGKPLGGAAPSAALLAQPTAPAAGHPQQAAATKPPLPNVRHVLLTKAAVKALPRVVAALGDAGLARRGDRLSVVAPKDAPLQEGERYVALALEAHVDDLDGAAGGQLLSAAGVVRASAGGTRAEVVLETPLAEVEAGQFLAPISAFVVPAPRPATNPEAPADFVAQVLVVEDAALLVGGHKLVFLGAGAEDGLAPGMRLWLVDGQKPKLQGTHKAASAAPPAAPTGELVVLQVQDHHASCTVLYSTREIGRGQVVRGGQGVAAAPTLSH